MPRPARLLLAVLIAGLAGPLSVAPNGGTVRVAKAPVGPYLVSVWSQPDPARVGRLDVSVAVMRPATEEALLDARVALTAERAGAGGGAATVTLVPGAGGNPLYYHRLVEIPAPGRWRLTVAVEGAAGAGRTTFEIDVEPARSPAWGVALGAAAGLAVLWWIVRGSRRAGG
jgi:hypothetical protein